MRLLKLLFTAAILLSLPLLITSCDDNDVMGPDDLSQIPSPPNFSMMQMETGIFARGDGSASKSGDKPGILAALHAYQESQAQMTGESEEDPFQLAYFLVGMVQSAYSLHGTYATFFTLNVAPNAVEVSGNEYLWDFSVQDSETDGTVDIRVTAVVRVDEVDWTVVASADLVEGGFGEQQVIDGTSAFDGSSGEWAINLDIQDDGFTYASTAIWDSEAGQLEKLDISTTISEDENGFFQHVEGVYTLDNTIASISSGQIQSPEFEGDDYFGDIDITQPFSVSWDTENGSGTVSVDGQTLCWDEDQMATDC